MDMLSVHPSSKNCKHAKPKKKSKPIKVVYISNPIKVKTTASKFRALVQELTGRDSDLDGDTGRFSVDGGLQMIPDDQLMKVGDNHVPQVPQIEAYQESQGKSDETFSEAEPFDNDVFNLQMLENFAGGWDWRTKSDQSIPTVFSSRSQLCFIFCNLIHTVIVSSLLLLLGNGGHWPKR